MKFFTPSSLAATALLSAVAVAPFVAPAPVQPWLAAAAPRWLAVFGGCLAALALAATAWRFRAGRVAQLVAQVRSWGSRRPVLALCLAAAAGTLASSYPVIFLGKSFISPNIGTVLLYQDFPTLPGSHEKHVLEYQGSDFGAVMWHHLPLSMLEHRALFRDHELPLWDRYNATGVVLLGQSQSMFGDPLHMLLPVVFNGAAWAWDLKYLAAKWLFALGLALLVWRIGRHLPSALLVAGIADFIGFFLYRVNHPALFSFCYAPWILYCWVSALQSPDLRGTARWMCALLLANWAELTSGTAKEAYMLLLTMNFTGALALAMNGEPWRRRLQRLALLAWGGVLFVLLSSPIWLIFSDALKASFTLYDDPHAYQIRPSLLLGLFDEIFYRPFNELDHVYNPSVNFLFLLGLLAFLVYLREALASRLVRAVAASALVSLAFAFGLVPAVWIVKLPILRNVIHIDNTFSCALIIQIGILAGVGFQAAARNFRRPEARFEIGVGLLLLAALIFPYLADGQTVQRSTQSFLHWGESLPRSAFVSWNLVFLPAAAIGLVLAARRALRRAALTPAALVFIAACALVLLGRHGLHAGTAYQRYIVNPEPRADFHARSAGIEGVRAQFERGPYRSAGIDGNLFPGWTAVYGIEGINGPDALINLHYRQLQDAFGLRRDWGWRLIVELETLRALQPYYDFLNVRYFFQYHSDLAVSGRLMKPVARADIDVYESTSTPWPRAFFSDRVIGYDSPAQFAALVKQSGGHPFAAVQRGDPAAPRPPARAAAPRPAVPARDYRLTTNHTNFTIDAPGPGVIVLQEAYLPMDFRVSLDGRSVPYFRVNHAFKGIAVDRAGVHRIKFEFWPHHMTLSLSLAAAGLLGVLGTAGCARRRTRPA